MDFVQECGQHRQSSLVRPRPIYYLFFSQVILTSIVACVAFQQYTLHNRNEQFFQVGLLDWALISLGLALSPPSTSVSSDFMVLSKCFIFF